MTEETPRDEAFHLAGDRLGKFVILSELGRGSMGVVYEAFQDDLKRKVALKILPANITLDLKQVKRFQREAESVARLRHDNVIQIYEVGEIDQTHYFAMELVDGKPLDTEFGRDKDSIRKAASIAMQAARGLAHAHEKGVVHRDIKPGNLLVDRSGRVVVTDFGLARLTDSASLTSTDAIVGTPKYMSPEQILPRVRQPIDGRTDVYSLGATLYHIVSGHPPHEAPTVQGFIKSILEERVSTPRKHNKQIPFDLATIILRCLEKEPKDRYQTASDLADDLERFLAGERILAKPKGAVALAVETVRRHRIIAALSAVALVAVVVVAVVFGGQAAESTRRAEFEARLRGISENTDYVEAFAQVDALAREYPDNPEVIALHKRVHLSAIEANADLDLAVQQVEKLRAERPGDFDVERVRREIYRKRAQRSLEQRRLDPDFVVEDLEKAQLQGSFWHVMMLVLADRTDEARAALARLPEDAPLRRLGEARLALKEGRPADAKALLAEEPSENPELPEERIFYYLTLAEAHGVLNEKRLAVEYGGKAIASSTGLREPWLRTLVLQRASAGGVDVNKALQGLGEVVFNSRDQLKELVTKLAEPEAEVAQRFVRTVLALAGQKREPAPVLVDIAKKRLQSAKGRARSIATLLLAVAELLEGKPDAAHEALDKAPGETDLDPYLQWCRSLVYVAEDERRLALDPALAAIESALAREAGFPELEDLFRHTVLLVEGARGNGEQQATKLASDYLRRQLVSLRQLLPVQPPWISELLGRLSS